MDKQLCYPASKISRLILFVAALFLFFVVQPQETYGAIEDFVYVIDQYGERWRPGEMTNTNIFATVIEDTVANPALNGEKVIAPGTSGNYSFTIHNTYEYPIEYTVIGRDQNVDELPLDFKLRVANGPWITQGENSWNLWSTTFPLNYKRTLESGMSETINLQWQWPFERNRDPEDTDYGVLATTRDLIYELSLNVVVESDEGTTPTNEDPGNSGTVPDTNGNTPADGESYIERASSFFSERKWRSLPQTGESLAKASIVIGFLIVFFVFIIWRRKGRQDEQDS
ncbi:LPXTG cell wall anchor domain-containing protein [Enterococcus sp. AZ109]|uniref:LPXTG cell wall anchor domain-containing protein n=1 Tax=Enterococcus sp. AZ109 TaxID=2774634 RepID=UPI003F26E152